MSVAVSANFMKALRFLAQAQDPRQAILDTVGPYLDDFDPLYGNVVLVAHYVEPEITGGLIIKPDETLLEQLWQGKVGMMLKAGEGAFRYRREFPYFATYPGEDETTTQARWDEFTPKLGDWLFYKTSSTWAITVADRIICRLVNDTEVMGKLKRPDILI